MSVSGSTGRERVILLVILAASFGAAIERGVLPSLSFSSMSAPCSISSPAMSSRSLCAAQCSGAEGLTDKYKSVRQRLMQ